MLVLGDVKVLLMLVLVAVSSLLMLVLVSASVPCLCCPPVFCSGVYFCSCCLLLSLAATPVPLSYHFLYLWSLRSSLGTWSFPACAWW